MKKKNIYIYTYKEIFNFTFIFAICINTVMSDRQMKMEWRGLKLLRQNCVRCYTSISSAIISIKVEYRTKFERAKNNSSLTS